MAAWPIEPVSILSKHCLQLHNVYIFKMFQNSLVSTTTTTTRKTTMMEWQFGQVL